MDRYAAYNNEGRPSRGGGGYHHRHDDRGSYEEEPQVNDYSEEEEINMRRYYEDQQLRLEEEAYYNSSRGGGGGAPRSSRQPQYHQQPQRYVEEEYNNYDSYERRPPPSYRGGPDSSMYSNSGRGPAGGPDSSMYSNGSRGYGYDRQYSSSLNSSGHSSSGGYYDRPSYRGGDSTHSSNGGGSGAYYDPYSASTSSSGASRGVTSEVVGRVRREEHGAATSVYPQGYTPDRQRREDKWKAEEAKLAQFGANGGTISRTPSIVNKAPTVPRVVPEVPKSTPMIEIMPGHSVPLRGSVETRECVARDYITPCLCYACESDLFCIQDADYVLCPNCRSINPLSTEEGALQGKKKGGVGLGFSMEVLQTLQQEIIAERKGHRPKAGW